MLVDLRPEDVPPYQSINIKKRSLLSKMDNDNADEDLPDDIQFPDHRSLTSSDRNFNHVEDISDNDVHSEPTGSRAATGNYIPAGRIHEEDSFDSFDPGYGAGTTPPRNHRQEIRCHKFRVSPKRLVLPKHGSPKGYNTGSRGSLTLGENLEAGQAFINPVLGSTIMQQKRKSLTMERSLQREYKNNLGSHDGDVPEAAGIGMIVHTFCDPLPSPIPKVDSNVFFRSVNSQQRSQSPTPSSPTATRTKKISVGMTHCPDNRTSFHRIFSEMVRIGGTKKDNVEPKSVPVWQESNQQKDTFQTEWNQLLWLELKAVQNGLTVLEEDQRLVEAREMIPAILREILLFKFDPSSSGSQDPSRCPMKGTMRKMRLASLVVTNGSNQLTDHQNGGMWSSPHQVCDTCSTPLLKRKVGTGEGLCMPLSAALTNYIEKTRQAWKQINDIMRNLEKAEALFPTLSALHNSYPLCKLPPFRQRIDILCLWLNITSDLSHKLEQTALMLGIMDIKGVFWPGILEPDSLAEVEIEETASEHTQDVPSVLKPLPRRLNFSDGTLHPEALGVSSDSNGTPVEHTNSLQRSVSVKFDISQKKDDDDEKVPSLDGRGDTSHPAMRRRHSMPLSSFRTPTLDDSPRVNRIFSQCHFSFDYNSATSMYRPFVDRSLKHSGLRKMTAMLYRLLGKTLQMTKQVLQKPAQADGVNVPRCKRRPSSADYDDVSGQPLPFTMSIAEDTTQAEQQQYDTLSMHGAWSEGFQAIGLPLFTPAYLFLLRIPLDVMHECLRFRLEHKPAVDPSAHSIQQLIYECKEAIRSSVHMKQYYQSMASAVMPNNIKAQEHAESDIEEYENDLQEMLGTYFEYLHSWILMLQRLPHASISLKNILEEEWDFTKEICPHVRGGEAQAGKRFCIMASNLLLSTGDYLEESVVDVSSCHQDNQLHGHATKHIIISSCRCFKLLFHEMRGRASKALGFAKMLRKDLEIAAEFQRNVPTSDLLQVLNKSGHIKVNMEANITSHLMFVPKHLQEDIPQILQLLDDLCGREDMPLMPNDVAAMAADSIGYLLLVRCNSTGDGDPKWNGACIDVTPDVETTIVLSDIQVKSLLLVVNHSSQLHGQRKAFEHSVGKAATLTSDQTSSHNTIAEALDELKQNALGLCHSIVSAIKQVDENLDIDSIVEIDETEKINMVSYFKETMHQCFSVGFDYHKEVTRLLSGEARQKLAKSVQNLASMWMRFVLEKCEKGRGTRPRWANHGMDFLVVASEPRNVAHLSDRDFDEMTRQMQKCISHIIGNEDRSCGASPALSVTSPSDGSLKLARAWSKSSRPASETTPSPHMGSPVSFGELHRPNSTDRLMSLFPNSGSPTEDRQELPYPKPDGRYPISPPQSSAGRMFRCISKESSESAGSGSQGAGYPSEYRWARIQSKVDELDTKRNKKLQSLQMIGQVSDQPSDNKMVNINCKKVTFRWQRGRKIGEGQTGTTVYSCINMDTGETLAMKEVHFQRNDHTVIRAIAEELKNFEGIRNPSLVQYYGVEIHREELLIFMEYCDEGTIAEVAKAGLPEDMVRVFAQEITKAISILHEHGIVHRDIKGANVFLSSDGHVKLGDFGCAAKMQNAKTLMGELTAFTGTAAYMAPEVITQPGGGKGSGKSYGRAADVWSLGCVVIEMATGKRPWHEYDHEFTILYKVGMGAIPYLTDSISAECKDFLSKCLVHDPAERWTANQLLDHPFLKVRNKGGDVSVS